MLKNQKNLAYLIGGLLVLLLAVGGYIVVRDFINSQQDLENQQAQTEIKADVTVRTTDGRPSYSVEGITFESGQNAIDILQMAADVDISVEGEKIVVTRIDDRSLDAAKGEYWELVVNGQVVNEDPATYIVENGDDITWRVNFK